MIKCSFCGKPIKKIGVMSPTTDPKRRNQCLKCGGKWMMEKEIEKDPNYWRIFRNKLASFGIVDEVVVDYIQGYVKELKDTALREQKEEIIKKIRKVRKPYCINDYYDANVVEALDEVLELLKNL